MSIRSCVCALVAGLALSGPLVAQEQRRPGPQADRAEMERRVQDMFAELVRTQLGLEREDALVFGQAVLTFQQERQALLRREAELRRRLRLEEGAGRGMGFRGELLPEAEAQTVLREMRALRTAEHDLYVREQDRLMELLTPGQLVRYYLLREQLADGIGRLRGGAPGGAAGGLREPPASFRRPGGSPGGLPGGARLPLFPNRPGG